MLSCDGRFTYRGGALPLPAPLANRATGLTCRAAETLRSPFGYLGMDLVLGDDPEGQEDVIIEINGQAIGSVESFVELVSSIRPHQQATLLAVDHGTGNQGYVRVRVR